MKNNIFRYVYVNYLYFFTIIGYIWGPSMLGIPKFMPLSKIFEELYNILNFSNVLDFDMKVITIFNFFLLIVSYCEHILINYLVQRFPNYALRCPRGTASTF